MAWLAKRIDDMNAFRPQTPGFEPNDWTSTIGSIRVFDSAAILVNSHREQPTHRISGQQSFGDVNGTPFEHVVEGDHRRQLASLGRQVARLCRMARNPLQTVRRVRTRRPC